MQRSGRRARIGMAGASVVLVFAMAACSSGTGSPQLDLAEGPAPDAIQLSQAREGAILSLETLAQHADPQVRGNALEGLLEAPGRSSEWLRRGLQDSSPGVRAIALMGVGRTQRADLAEQAAFLLRDRSPWVRLSAAYALAANGDTRGMPVIASTLLNSDDPRLRAQAALVLGELGNDSAVPLLREALLRDMPLAPAGQRRLMVLQMSEAMVKLGEAEQVQPIRAALYPARPEDLEATALAARILGEVGDHASENQLALLTARLDEQGNMLPPEVRLSAIYALAQLGRTQGDVFAIAYLSDPRAPVRGLAALSLGEIGKTQHLARLEPLMADPDPGVRVHASAAVVRLTRP
ncbi:MAG: HEAT repeat domain-containing protein [Phycisphaerales bacterium]